MQFIIVILFGCSCWSLGDYLLDHSSPGKKHLFLPWARPAIAFTLGNAVYSYLITLQGFLGLYASLFFIILLLLGSIIFLSRYLFKYRNKKIPNIRHFRNDDPLDSDNKKDTKELLTTLVLFGLVAIFILPVFMQAVIPPFFRDALVYHLLLPKVFLETGHITSIAGNVYSTFPKGHEALMTLLMSVAGDRAAQGFSILQYLCAVMGIYSMARYLSGPWSAVVCSIGFATVPPAIYFSGCGYVEPALIMTFTSVMLLWMHLLTDNTQFPEDLLPNKKDMLTMGVIAGWLPAVKYTGLIYMGIIFFIILWQYRKTPFKNSCIPLCIFLLGALPGMSWMIWNWINLGNPVYPFAWSIFGGTGWNQDLSKTMGIYMKNFGMGRGLSDYLLLPWRLAFSGRLDTVYFDGAIGPFLLIFVSFAIAGLFLMPEDRIKKASLKGIIFAAIVSASFFIFGTQQARFWLPAQMLISVCSAPIVGKCIRHLKGNKILISIFIPLMTISLAWNYNYLSKRWKEIGISGVFSGMESEDAFLKRKVPGYTVMDYINTNLPDSSRIFCVWTGAYAYYMDRQYYSDTFIEDITLKQLIEESINGQTLAIKLKETGFTHVFINYYLAEKNMEADQLIIFQDLLKTRSELIFHNGNYLLFHII